MTQKRNPQVQQLGVVLKRFNSQFQPPTIDPMHAELVYRRTALLFGQFRRDDAADPEIFSDSIAAVLSEYPAEIIVEATDPRTGIARKQNFLPTAKEVGDFCEALANKRRRTEERERNIREQFAERDENERLARNAMTRAEVEAKLGRPIGQLQTVEAKETAEAVKAKYGISDEVWNAVRDAPLRHKRDEQNFPDAPLSRGARNPTDPVIEVLGRMRREIERVTAKYSEPGGGKDGKS